MTVTVNEREKEKKLPSFLILMLLFACRSSLWLYIIVRGRDPVRITHPMYLVEIMILLGLILSRAAANRKNVFIPMVIAALVAAFAGNTAPLAALWVFIVGPLVGAALAAVVYKYLED